MAKTLIDVDENALALAQRALATTTTEDTVNRSLVAVAALDARRRDLARFRDDGHADLRNADVMSRAWRK